MIIFTLAPLTLSLSLLLAHSQSMEELIEKTVPENIRLDRALKLDPALGQYS